MAGNARLVSSPEVLLPPLFVARKHGSVLELLRARKGKGKYGREGEEARGVEAYIT